MTQHLSYADFVKKGTSIKTASTMATNSKALELLLGALGMATEAGEAGDHVKKFFFHGATLNPEAVKKELGDVRWYYQQYLNYFGWTDADITETNQFKLRARAPERYGDTFEELTCDSGICPEERITCEDCRMRILQAERSDVQHGDLTSDVEIPGQRVSPFARTPSALTRDYNYGDGVGGLNKV